MSEVKAFFRHCPACGRRFQIKVVRREPGEEDAYVSERRLSDTYSTEERPFVPIILDGMANEPVIINEKQLSYTYICRKCGHKWTEIHEETHTEHPFEGYTGD